MSLGVVMLVHSNFERAASVVRHWAIHGCPVVIHIDLNAPDRQAGIFRDKLSDLPSVVFSRRRRCDWGTWSLVAATQHAAFELLDRFAEVEHVFLTSGSCLPLRPVPELRAYLGAAPHDYIESVTAEDVTWTVGGLNRERFVFRFPFAWKRRRRLFDGYVRLQQAIGYRRSVPPGLVPHLGSQWWCLRRDTLTRIRLDTERDRYERYFRRVWIPDESYFQTMVRLHSDRIESRSLTLSRFDFQGKPHIFYDDHLHLLKRSECFVARKVWPAAERLHAEFLRPHVGAIRTYAPRPGRIDSVFSDALAKRTEGRPGLEMAGRYPNDSARRSRTARPYSVFHGFDAIFDGWEDWLAANTTMRVHGHLFSPEGAEFAGRQAIDTGGLSSNPVLRDYDPAGFLRALIWNRRGHRQGFQFSPSDAQPIAPYLAEDPNADIWMITGAWSIPLFRSDLPFDVVRARAATLQKAELAWAGRLKSAWVGARARIWTLTDVIQHPEDHTQAILDDPERERGDDRRVAPQVVDLTGLAEFLQRLKNAGMDPRSVGDFEILKDAIPSPTRPRRAKIAK